MSGQTASATGPANDPEQQLVEGAAAAAGAHEPLVRAFAHSALRRVPRSELRRVDPDVGAQWLRDALEWFLDALEEPGQSIRIFTPDVSLDGHSDAGSVIEVVGQDRPFLLATITRTIQDFGPGIVRSLHPILGVVRDDRGRVVDLTPAREAEHRASFVHIELDTVLDDVQADALRERLERALGDVMVATSDHHAMRARVQWLAHELRTNPPAGREPDDVRETAELLEWLLDDNFILLGWREYAIDTHEDGTGTVQADPDTSLGILRDLSGSRYRDPVSITDIPEEQRTRMLGGPLLRVSRSNRRSTVHRLRRMEYVGVLWNDEQGRVTREYRLLGLFTSRGLTEPARSTPVLRRKLRAILEREDVVPGSHDETTLISLFQSLPKDELFDLDVEELHQTLIELLEAEEGGRIKVKARVDSFTRTVSVLLAMPRDDYSSTVRHRVTQLLLQRFGSSSRVDVDLALGDREDTLARFRVHVEGPVPAVPMAALERDIQTLVRPWRDQLQAQLVADFGEADGQRLARTVGTELPASYRNRTTPEVARDDVVRLDVLLSGREPLSVWIQELDDGVHVKIAQRNVALELSDFLPILESVGLRVSTEHPYWIDTSDGHGVSLHDFLVHDDDGAGRIRHRDVTAQAIVACAQGRCEIDSLNKLVVDAGLSWNQVSILRAFRRFRRQVGTAYTTEYVNEALTDNPEATSRVLEYFETKFDPDRDADESAITAAREAAVAACDAIERLDHDRIVRGVLLLVDATLRTNAYRDDRFAEDAAGRSVPYVALKFDSSRIPEAPSPVPHREIFVYSPAVEGVHLRGGPVARGGLRWSDRRDDVRTEVLGLMKAQVVKNAVIVPTGAKGGFVLKRPPTAPDALRADVERQYVTFIRALLDVTDDVRSGKIMPPPRVRRHDGDDPYLVVAADKGTATFSDTANAIAEERGFWLGDAFASGGSHGYDHKKLGITARGAWTAISRHFRELGVDVQEDPVTVAGIGDMSGDVFGNGMLLSRTLRLVAAFDHRDIFIDPDPDPEASWGERARLFELSRSSWQDYDRDLISAGGGVWSRDEKRIELSKEIRETLRIDDAVLPPHELIRAILRAPVDLLYAGGIGTYIKASTESHEDVGDRTNDELRVDATEVRARVLGEGANLAITQRGRIQYARRGGRVDQDAVHNAAGVDISDHEVNLKILLREAEERGRIDRARRDEILAEVCDDVVEHVLEDVDRQNWQLSQQAARGGEVIGEYRATITDLERLGLVSREVDVLPTDEELAERAVAGAGLTRPELATIIAGAKRAFVQDVLASALPDDPTVSRTLRTYFPPLMVDEFGDLLEEHRLRRELTATIVANDLVNALGPTFAFRLADETGRTRADVISAYWCAREVADASRWWDEIDDHTRMLAVERQRELKEHVDLLVRTLTRTYLDDRSLPDVAAIVARDRDAFEVVDGALPRLGTRRQRQHRNTVAQRFMDDLVEPALADLAAGASDLAFVPDIASLAREFGSPNDPPLLVAVADTLFRLGDELGLDRLAVVLDRTTVTGGWQARQATGLAHDLRRLRRDAVAEAVAVTGGLDGAVETLLDERAVRLDHVRETIAAVENEDETPLDAIAVAIRAVGDVLVSRHA